MKNIILGLAVFASTSSLLAAPVLTCETTGAGGALIKNLVIEKGTTGFVLKIESVVGDGLNEVKVLEVISTPVSTKYILDANTGAKTSLVIYKKQAVILYEANSAADYSEKGAYVEFLSCK